MFYVFQISSSNAWNNILKISPHFMFVWAWNLPKRWECPTIFGRKFLEISAVISKTMPLKFASPRFWVQLYFVNKKINFQIK